MPDTERSLSTGMGNLDNKFERGGFRPGSVVTVRSPPAALGRLVLYTLAAGRPTVYLPVGPPSCETIDLLRAAGNLDAPELVVEELPPTSATSALATLLEDLDLPAGGTVLLEPANLLEHGTEPGSYTTVLSRLQTLVSEAGGLAALLAVETDRPPTHRWLTVQRADTVLTVVHERSSHDVHDHLALEKLHPEQQLHESDDRVFRLPRSLDIDIDTKRNLSP